jgi:hypothetical protein
MLKNRSIFLVWFFLVVLTNAVHHGCISSVEEEEQLFMTFPEDTPLNSLTISDCGNTNDILQIRYIHMSPDPPRKGQMLTIEALGFLREQIEYGSYIKLTVKLLGLIPIYNTRLDLCEYLMYDNPCPIERGRQELYTDNYIPEEIPPVSIYILTYSFCYFFSNSFHYQCEKG